MISLLTYRVLELYRRFHNPILQSMFHTTLEEEREWTLSEGELYYFLLHHQKLVLSSCDVDKSNLLVEDWQWRRAFLYYRHLSLEYLEREVQRWCRVIEPWVGQGGMQEFAIMYRSLQELPPPQWHHDEDALATRVMHWDEVHVQEWMEQTVHTSGSLAKWIDTTIRPTLEGVGESWLRSQIDVDGEHRATALVERLYRNYLPPQSMRLSQCKILIMLPQGQLHLLGAHMITDVLKHEGWDVLQLRLEHDWIGAIALWEPCIIIFSVMLAWDVASVYRAIETIHQTFVSPKMLIALGGKGIEGLEEPLDGVDFQGNSLPLLIEYIHQQCSKVDHGSI